MLPGPDITAKLCLAPNNTLLGVAVSGGENKTNTGNDFRVTVLSKNYGASDRLTAYARSAVNRLATGALAGLDGEEEKEGVLKGQAVKAEEGKVDEVSKEVLKCC